MKSSPLLHEKIVLVQRPKAWCTLTVWRTLAEMKRHVRLKPHERAAALCVPVQQDAGSMLELHFAVHYLQHGLLAHEILHGLIQLVRQWDLDLQEDEEMLCEISQHLTHTVYSILYREEMRVY